MALPINPRGRVDMGALRGSTAADAGRSRPVRFRAICAYVHTCVFFLSPASPPPHLTSPPSMLLYLVSLPRASSIPQRLVGQQRCYRSRQRTILEEAGEQLYPRRGGTIAIKRNESAAMLDSAHSFRISIII